MGPRASLNQTPNDVWQFDWRASGNHDARDDRSIALMAFTVLEQGLEAALLTKSVALDPIDEYELFSSESGSLISFHAKTQISYALGIIGKKTKSDLVCLRKIRNKCA